MCLDCETCRLLNHRHYKYKKDSGGYQEVCSDCETHGLKKHGLTRYDCILYLILYTIYYFMMHIYNAEFILYTIYVKI